MAQQLDWTKRMGGADYDDANGIAVDPLGNVVTTGGFEGPADFDPGPGTFSLTPAGGFGYDVFVSKLDAAGQFLWAKSMGGTLEDVPWAIALDGSGNVYTAGFFQGTADFDPGPGVNNLTSSGGYDIFLSKLDSNGNFVWAKRMSGPSNEEAYSLAMDGSDNIYVAGYFQGTVDFDPGPGTTLLTSIGMADTFICKLDHDGHLLWARRLGGPGEDWSNAVKVDAAGHVHAAGAFNATADFDPGPGSYDLTSAGASDIFIVELDGSGQWVRALRMGGPEDDYGNGIQVDAAGDVYATGAFRATADFDPGPGTFNLSSAGDRDVFVCRLGAAGSLVWAKQMGGAAGDIGIALALDGSGNIYATGEFYGTSDFDPGPAAYSLSSAGLLDGFAFKLDPDGNFVWAKRMGGPSYDYGIALAVDEAGNAWITGDFSDTATFGSTTLTSAGFADTFVTRLSDCRTSFVQDRGYGSLLFRPLCTRRANALTDDVYNVEPLGVLSGPNERFFLSSLGKQLSPVVVDDEIHIGGTDTGLGPYQHQPGVPPYLFDVPIEQNLQSLAPLNVTTFLPAGPSSVIFELLDTDRQIYGNTALYLVCDCGIWLDQSAGQTRLHWISEQVQIGGSSSHLDVVTGRVSQLKTDESFAHACFLGSFFDTVQAVDTRPAPPPGDAYYYLVSGTCASPIGYGNSSQGPRQGLPPPMSCQ